MEHLFLELDSVNGKSVNLELDIGAIEGLKKMPVDMFDGVFLGEAHANALILCVDVRNFSDFLCVHADNTVFSLIKEFTSNLLSCINQFGNSSSYYKFLGDGVFVIWDETNINAINEALYIFNSYTEFLDDELFRPYDSLGLAGALVQEKVFKYEISAEVSQLKYRDYVGYGINLACRLQTLASGKELILNEKLAKAGAIPFRVSETQEILKELHILKGLKEDDRKRVLFYDK